MSSLDTLLIMGTSRIGDLTGVVFENVILKSGRVIDGGFMEIYWMLFLAIDVGVYFSKYGF